MKECRWGKKSSVYRIVVVRRSSVLTECVCVISKDFFHCERQFFASNCQYPFFVCWFSCFLHKFFSIRVDPTCQFFTRKVDFSPEYYLKSEFSPQKRICRVSWSFSIEILPAAPQWTCNFRVLWNHKHRIVSIAWNIQMQTPKRSTYNTEVHKHIISWSNLHGQMQTINLQAGAVAAEEKSLSIDFNWKWQTDLKAILFRRVYFWFVFNQSSRASQVCVNVLQYQMHKLVCAVWESVKVVCHKVFIACVHCFAFN